MSKFFQVEILNTLVICEFGPEVILIANLACDENLRAILLNVLIKLASRHMLVLFPVADIASEFGAVELSVGLQFV